MGREDVDEPLTTTSTAPATGSAGNGHAKLFVSYSRKDRSFVERLSEALKVSGQDIWVDLQDIRPSEDWLNAIHLAIEGADAFVFVVSPDSVDPTSVCAQEIEHAVAHNKRIIPIVCRPVDTRAIRVPEPIGRLNWVPFFDADGFELSVEKLVSAIETDLEWVKQHTRLLERAVEWDAAKRDDSFLLQKNDLAAAERWLTVGPTKEPKPTALQTQYVIDSRASATKRQRRLTFFGLTAALLIGIGGTVAVLQFQQAEERRKEALSRELAAEAQFERDRRLDQAVLLSAKALSTRALQEAIDSAISVGQATFGVRKILRAHTKRITAICFLPGSRLLISAAEDGRTILWDLDAGSPLEILSSSIDDTPRAIACSNASQVVAVGSDKGHLTLWRIDGDHAKPFLKAADTDGFYRLQFSANGALLVSGSRGTVKVRSTATGKVVGSPVDMKYAVTAVAVSNSGDLVAVGTSDRKDRGGEVHLWSDGGKNKVFSANPFAVGVESVIIHGQSGKVKAVGDGGDVKAWNMDGSNAEIAFPEKIVTQETNAAAFNMKGEFVAVAQGRTAVIGELNAHGAVQRLAGHAGTVYAVSFSPDGLLAATGSEDGNVIVHRLRSENELHGGWIVAGSDDSSDDVSFTPDGAALIVDGASKSPRRILLPAPSMAGVAPASPAPKLPAERASRSPNPKEVRVSIVTEGDKATLREEHQKRDIAEMIPERGQSVVAGDTALDGKRWVAASANVLRIGFTAESRSRMTTLPAGFGSISAVALSPDGTLIAVAGSDLLQASAGSAGMERKQIVLLNSESGRPIGGALEMLDPAPALKLVFSPDGLHLVSVSQSNTAVWIVGPHLWLRRACAVLQVKITATEWQRRAPGMNYPESCTSDGATGPVVK
jgi:WD40 repeat protein